MRRGMLGLELKHRFKGTDRLVNMSQPFLRQAKLKIQSGHCRINLLRLLKRLDRLFRLIRVQVSQAQKIISRRAVVIQLERLLALLDDLLVIVGQQISIGQVQARVQALGNQVYSL